MKNIFLATILLALVLVSCNQNKKQEEKETKATVENNSKAYCCPMHPEVKGAKGEDCSVCGMELTEPVAEAKTVPAETKIEVAPVSTSSFSIDKILNNYLEVKNALTKDDSKAAAAAAKELNATLITLNVDKIEEKSKKEFGVIADDAKAHSKNITANSGKLESQREHFSMLSKNMDDLIKTFGTNKKIYRDYCPMYGNGKNGYWISETKDIQNPYYGSEMYSCGGIVKVIP